jgi:hypothetical protein
MIAAVCLLRYNRIEGRTSANLDPNKQPDEEAVMSKKDLPSPEYLRQRLTYEPETGRLIWKNNPSFSKRWNSRFPENEAGTINPRGYLRVSIDNWVYQAHRIIWAIHYGEWADGEIDHIDGNKVNNRIDNLRMVDRVENSRNMRTPKDNTSGVMGVSRHKKSGKWTARIKANGVYHYLGLFVSFDDAVAARKKAEKAFGFHANHGRTTIAAEHIS